MLDMFSTMLGSNKVLVNVGNISVESQDKRTLSILIDGGITYDVFKMERFAPKDPTRLLVAGFYCGLLTSFISNHEFCHIYRGHAGYVSDLCDLPLYAHNNRELIDIVGDKFCQTCEMDADCFAITRCIHLAIFFMVNPQEVNDSKISSLFYPNVKKIIFDHLFVVYCFFRLSHMVYSPAERITHPPPLIRLKIVYSTIANWLNVYNKRLISDEELGQTFLEAISEAERAFLAVTYAKPPVEEFRQLDNEENNKLMNYILYNWNNVRPKIQKHAFEELPALKVIPLDFRF